MKQLNKIDKQILALRKQLADVHGSRTEVYTRIVGYLRAVSNWNKGKREEYDHRKPFAYETDTQEEESVAPLRAAEPAAEWSAQQDREGIGSFMLFYRDTCPGCPPVKRFLHKLDLPGQEVNVDHDGGLARAQQYHVMSVPTVVLMDKQGNVVNTVQNIRQLKQTFDR